MNKKMIGAVLGTLAFGTVTIAHAGEAPKTDAPAKADAPKAAKKPHAKKGGEKSCSGDKKGGEKSCSGEHKGGEKSCGADGKSCSGKAK